MLVSICTVWEDPIQRVKIILKLGGSTRATTVCMSMSCADPGIFVRWGPGQSDKKSSFFFFFFSPLLILQKSNGQFQRNLSFFKVPEGGSNIFQEGGFQLFPGGGGSNCLFPIETHITCDFPGGAGSGPPVPPSGSALVCQQVVRWYHIIHQDLAYR